MNCKDKISLITIVKGREQHLRNLLKGVSRSSYIPDEIIIVAIDELPAIVDFDTLPIKIVHLKSEGGHLPIAKARNTGAIAASNEHLVFLDVDCIPSSGFFEQIFLQGCIHGTLIMGNPRYLTEKITYDMIEEELKNLSIHHPHRPVVNGLEISADWMLFWSLCFYIPKSLFHELEGFDENYTGYGAEDTDFSLTLKQKGNYRFLLSEATVYHQQHPVYSPPVHQLDSIITNAGIFYKKWGRWVMENWLHAFHKHDLINWLETSTGIEKKNSPSKELINKCFQPEAPFM